jgi:small-conductance mechanosensitive channel
MESLEKKLEVFDPGTLIGALLLAGVLVLAGLVLSAGVRRMLRTVLEHDRNDHVDPITLTFLSHLAVLVLWVLLLTLYAHMVPALNRLGTTMLAGVGLVSVIVGFAAQTTLGNLVSGISLVLYKPFRRGDRLQVLAPTQAEFEIGTVEDITLGFTVLRTDDDREVIIANGTMAQQTMIKLNAAPKKAP